MNNELLGKALVGEVVLNYFTTFIPRILEVSVYADNSQGSVLCYAGHDCWKLVYKIDSDGCFELLDDLSGIMSVNKQ